MLRHRPANKTSIELRVREDKAQPAMGRRFRDSGQASEFDQRREGVAADIEVLGFRSFEMLWGGPDSCRTCRGAATVPSGDDVEHGEVDNSVQ